MLEHKHVLCLIILAASGRSTLFFTFDNINTVCACAYVYTCRVLLSMTDP